MRLPSFRSSLHLLFDMRFAAVLAAIVPLAALCVPWAAGSDCTKDDLGAFHLPVRAFYAEQLHRGESFDWMPSLYGGMYLTGEGQSGGYHPLHWLLYRWLPFHDAAAMEWIVGYPWMLLGTWLLLRRRIGALGAAYGAIAFTWCGFCLLHFIHPNAVAVVAHLPWLLWTLELAMTASSPRGAAFAQVGLALVFASQLLLGYPQYVYFSLWAAAGYLLFLWRENAAHGQRSVDGLMRVAIGFGLGTLLGAVQLLPTLDALRQSTRWTAGLGLRDVGALHPWNLMQLVAPYLLKTRVWGQNTHELGLYAGAGPLILAACALVEWKRLGRLRPLAWAACGLGAFALLWSFGPYSPLHRALGWIPLADSFRFPCRMIVIFQFALALLAAMGFRLLAARRLQSTVPARRVRFCAWGLVAVSLMVAGFGWMARESGYVAGASAVLAGPVLFAAAAIAATLAASGRRWALAVLMFLTAADLACYGLSYSVFPIGKSLASFTAAVDAPPGLPQGRVVADPVARSGQGLRTGNAILLAGWRRADGYAGLEPKQTLDLGTLAALRTADVRFVHRSSESEAIVGLLPGVGDWLAVPDPLGRARLAAYAVPSDNAAKDLQSIELATTALVDPRDFASLAWKEPRIAALGETQVRTDRPGRIVVDCDVPEGRLLVVSEAWHPGWCAQIDGQPRRVLRVCGDFLGCEIASGEHQVVLSFQPESLRLGKFDSLLGLGLLPVCLLAAGRRV